MEFLLSNLGLIATGAAGAAGGVVAIKGVPASVTWLKAWWTKGKADLATLKGGLSALELRVGALEQKTGVVPPPAATAAAPAAHA
jgi:hypothetical protein